MLCYSNGTDNDNNLPHADLWRRTVSRGHRGHSRAG